ncbi:MAG TPA: hypothetical protein VHX17_05470 [Candidatus Cybelea sp.]|jgi:hypothetical protein|nr:hypothetical protein [Candidatus Cybelea sp.]
MPRLPSAPAVIGSDARPLQHGDAVVNYAFARLDDPNDSRFNRSLGLNDLGKVVGYFGRGKPSDPNIGVQVAPPYRAGDFQGIAFPDATQTQITTVDDGGSFGGFYTDSKHDTYAFLEWKNLWFAYAAPLSGPKVTEITNMNGSNEAVGFWLNNAKQDVPFLLDLTTGVFQRVNTPDGTVSAVATGINTRGDICGYYKTASGVTQSFLRPVGNPAVQFAYPNSVSTKALGLSAVDHIVGSYVDASGVTHGFLMRYPGTPRVIWETIDEPQGEKATVVTGINLHDDIAGYYVDNSGRNHGFLGTVASSR